MFSARTSCLRAGFLLVSVPAVAAPEGVVARANQPDLPAIGHRLANGAKLRLVDLSLSGRPDGDVLELERFEIPSKY